MIRHRTTRVRRHARPRLETLEDRTLLSSSVIESFESGSLAAYQAAIRNNPGYNLTAHILPIAAHDGSNGLVLQDDYAWFIRNDSGSQVHQGDTLSAWVKLADVADGRAYLGFDAKNTAAAHSPLSQSGGLSVVMAANTNQLLIESHTGSNGIASFSTVAAVSQTYQAGQWYRLEVTWGAGGAITGRLYGSDGVTLLSTVSGTTTAPFPTGAGIAFRAFGHDKYFDTVVLDTGSTDTPAQRVALDTGLDAGWTAGDPPTPVVNGPSGGPAPVPWQYTSTPGTGIEVQLAAFNDLQQVPTGGIVNGVVGLAAMNNSLITGTSQVGWGDPLETPLLAQYIFRERPGELTQLIGASSTKHFFSSAHTDSQHLNPGENDTYGSSLNMVQSLYTDGSEIDPVTGTLHSPVDRGHLDNDGMVVNDSRTFSNNIQELLQVNVADLDPAQNPAGTRWFLAGNLFVDGEQDVSQASRWVEIVPHFNGTTFTFTYPNGAGGQLDFRTIPNLAQPAAGPYVTASTPSGNTFGPISDVIVTFNTPIDPTTFTTDSISSFTLTSGSTATVADLSGSLINVTQVDTAGKVFDISFQAQSAVGTYRLTFGPNVLDLNGNPMDQDLDQVAGQPEDAYTAVFTIQGPSITGATPTGNGFNPVSSVRVTFNEPVDPGTFTTALISSFTRTVGTTVTDLRSALQSVTPVAGSNNTQFDITFATQNGLGAYSLVVAPGVLDRAGNPTTTSFTDNFAIQGPKIIAGTPTGNANLPDPNRKVRVVFNEPINPATFTTSEVLGRGPNGVIIVSAVTPVAGSNNTQFDITFPQIATGQYTLLIGPDIQDMAGHKMDQDDDFVDGQVPDDMYVLQFGVLGLKVTASSLNSNQPGQAYDVHLAFNEPVDFSNNGSNLLSGVTLSGPDGAHTAFAVVPTAGSNFTQFDVLFAPLTAAGSYTLTVGPAVYDVYGNAMDQDTDATLPVEADDAYTNTFTLVGPRITATTVAPGRPVDHVIVTFDRSMDPSTFSTGSFSLAGPNGSPIAITGVAAVPYTNNTQFEVDFAPSNATGVYTLTAHAGIADAYGNALTGDVTTTFSIQVNYTATATDFQNIEIFGQAGTQTVTFTSGQVTADDDFGTINLGGNSFTFYGQTYNQLFVSSNGLITFGSGNSSYHPTSLSGSAGPTQASISPYWTDLIKTGTEPMIVWRIDGDQLIIEWYHVQPYPSGTSMTFQAILQLNTGGTPGDIVFNYSSVTGLGSSSSSVGVTVGVKDAGTASTVAHTVVEDGTSYSSTGDPRVQTGRALRFTAS